LEELNSYFTKFLPIKFGEKVSLQSSNRMREIVELRSIFCFFAKNMKYSLKNIGFHLGERDHTTVIHGLKSFRDLLETNEGFRQKYLTIHKYIIEQTKSVDYEPFTMDSMLEE
jgi:chromosomal replication initiator protein